MPVRLRSVTSKDVIHCRAPAVDCFISSNCAEKPGAITPPSAKEFGGSSTMALRIREATNPKSGNWPTIGRRAAASVTGN